jgi:hypothetical protein
MWVDASPAEILYLAQSLTGPSKAAATHAVATAMDKTRDMSFDDRGQFVFPCPMLRNGECSVYPLRPLACRAAASGDVEIWARAYNLLSDEQIPLPLPWMLVGSGYRLALAGAVKRSGLTYTAIELNSGLEVALSDATAERRWLSGENPFASAQRPPVDDIMDNPQYRAIFNAAFE